MLELDGTAWECWSCCKIMPTGAIYVRGYDDFVPMGGVVVVERMKHGVQNWYEGRGHAEDIYTPRLCQEQE